MKLDLTGNSPINQQYVSWLNQIATELRSPYTDLIRKLSEKNQGAIDWWVTPMASRNPYSCSLFLQICYLFLTLRIVEHKHPLEEVRVNSYALAVTLKKLLSSLHPQIRITHPQKAMMIIRSFTAFLRGFFASLYHTGNQYLFSKLFQNTSRPLSGNPIVLIDTFVYANSFSGEARDRHFTGLLDFIDDEDKKEIFFTPTFYKIRNYANLFKKIRMSKTNFLLKEDFLRLKDYVFALTHCLRAVGVTIPPSTLRGIDVTPLVREIYHESICSSSSIEGLLKYRFARRLSETKVSIRLIIDWFENQEIDHGANAGFRKYYPGTMIVGYQGYIVPKHYLCTYPAAYEEEHRVIPHQIAVVGKGLMEPAKEFYPHLNVVTAPAFRFQEVWRERKYLPDNKYFTILVSLPILFKECNDILNVLYDALRHPKIQGSSRHGYRFWIKHHPANTTAKIKKNFGKLWPKDFEFVSGSFHDLLEQSGLLISISSSTCVESLSKGVPVIVLGSLSGLTQNPIPSQITQDIWTLCYAAEDVVTAIIKYSTLDKVAHARHQAVGAIIRKSYFEPITKKKVKQFLCL